jgi:lysophospholipid acyltransferase
MTNQRFLYYVPWKICDAAVIGCGLGYNGQDPKTKKQKFDRILNITVSEIEFGSSPSTMMQVSQIVT